MSEGIVQKDPGAIPSFSIDLADYLTLLGGGLTVVGATWLLPVGITEVTSGFTASKVTIQTAGGTAGEDYEAICHFTLSDGQEDEKSLTIQVRETEAGALTDPQIVTIAEITFESYATINSLALALNTAQKVSIKEDLITWALIRDSHVKLSEEVDFDNERKREAIRRRIRKALGLPLYSEEVTGSTGSFAIPNIPVF